MTRLFLDLDGTILDVSERYRAIYRSMYEKYNCDLLDYWGMRRACGDFDKTLENIGLPLSRSQEFKNEWLSKIEKIEYLNSDVITEGTRRWLIVAKKTYDLILCTARQNEANLNYELNKEGILGFFSTVIRVTNGREKHLAIAKYAQTKKIVLGGSDWLIGDTEFDINSAKLLKINSCGVLSGLGNRALFEGAGASLVCETLADFQIN